MKSYEQKLMDKRDEILGRENPTFEGEKIENIIVGKYDGMVECYIITESGSRYNVGSCLFDL